MKSVVAVPARERGMLDQVQQERDVGLDAADAELAQRAIGALRSPRSSVAPHVVTLTSSESKNGVITDAAEAVAAVQPDGEAAGRAIGRDAPVVGDEMAFADPRW